jgi:hypothetical protein
MQVHHTPPQANVKTSGQPTLGHPTHGKPTIGPVFSKEEILLMKAKVPHIIKHVPIRGKKPHSTTPPGDLKCVNNFHFLICVRINQ